VILLKKQRPALKVRGAAFMRLSTGGVIAEAPPVAEEAK